MRWGEKAKEKEKGNRREGGGRGGQTEDRQMEGIGETDGREERQMEKGTVEREGRKGAAGERR